MQYRPLGRTGFSVSEISFGAWAIGGAWGTVDDEESMKALHRYLDLGGNFIDTADVYGDGRSERLVARLKKERPKDKIVVATKAGRRLPKQTVEGYTYENLNAWINRSLANLQTESLDLLQLHCPPTALYEREDVFEMLDGFVESGKIRFYGVSVEKISEAERAIQYPNVQSVQIIFNLFRQRPAEHFLSKCIEKKVGVLARVPLASGLLSGKMTRETQFAGDDHRNFNRVGQAFDAGETFSGLGDHLDDAFAAVEELKKILPPGMTLAQFALKWISMTPGVTCSIPGAKRADQVESNMKSAEFPPLSRETLKRCEQIYEQYVKAHVAGKW